MCGHRVRSNVEGEKLIVLLDNIGGASLKMDVATLKGRKRDRKTARARQVAMFLLREETNMGSTAIGRLLGGKDHSTVLHGCRTIENQQKVDDKLRLDIL